MAGEQFYFTGEPCPNGHTSMRRVKDGDCPDCYREKRRRLRKTASGRARAAAQRKRRAERLEALGLTREGFPRIYKTGKKQSKEERKEAKSQREKRQRLAYKALAELGIEI